MLYLRCTIGSCIDPKNVELLFFCKIVYVVFLRLNLLFYRFQVEAGHARGSQGRRMGGEWPRAGIFALTLTEVLSVFLGDLRKQ